MAIDRITNNRIDALELILTGKIQDTTVNYAIDSNIAFTTIANGVHQIAESTLDGVPVTQGKRYLLLNQTNKAENGIYVVQSLSPVVLTRPYDFYYYLNIHNTRAQVLEGSKQEEFFLITTTEPFTLGLTEIIVTATERQPDVLTMLGNKLDNSVAKLTNQASTPSATANATSVYAKAGELYVLNEQGVEAKVSLDALQNKASIAAADVITIKDSEDGFIKKNITADALTDGGTF